MKIWEIVLGSLIMEEHSDGSEGTGGGASAGSATGTEGSEQSAENSQHNADGGSQNADSSEQNAGDDFEQRFNDRLFEMAKSNGREITAIDELFKVPEPERVEINPYENLDPSVKSFLDYHKETNRSYDDYRALNTDISAIPDIDLARDRVKQETGQSNLSNEQIDSYLEKKLGIDLSDLADMDIADQIELTAFAKPTRESKLAEQEKYKQPIENKNAKPPLTDDMVELENGERMAKATYDNMVAARQRYVEGLEKGKDSIVPASFSVTIDDNGSEKTVNYGYEYSKEDVQNMASKAFDLEATIGGFRDEQGDFRHNELMEGLFWMDKNNRGKALSAIIHKVRAEVTEELMKGEGNVNFGKEQTRFGLNTSRGTSSTQQSSGFGVKVNFNPKN